jgi:hypothetical protein
MNCTKCKTKAVIGLPRHNAAFCKGCFNGFVHDQVARAIKSEKMFGKEDRILVAVSGGKDSLALWDILLKLGYRANALYVNLGIGTYSEQSHQGIGPTHPSPDLLYVWDDQTLPIQSRGDRTTVRCDGHWP